MRTNDDRDDEAKVLCVQTEKGLIVELAVCKDDKPRSLQFSFLQRVGKQRVLGVRIGIEIAALGRSIIQIVP